MRVIVARAGGGGIMGVFATIEDANMTNKSNVPWEMREFEVQGSTPREEEVPHANLRIPELPEHTRGRF